MQGLLLHKEGVWKGGMGGGGGEGSDLLVSVELMCCDSVL